MSRNPLSNRIMSETRVSVKAKLFNLGLNSVVIATHLQRGSVATIAITTPNGIVVFWRLKFASGR
jgi:GTP cyclohydrolase FolE2